MKSEMSVPAPRNGMRPVHPGEVLREDFLKPLGMSANALAKALRVPASRINDIVFERRGVSVDTAMRLVRYFGGDVQSWLNLQLAYDLKVAQKTSPRRSPRKSIPRPRDVRLIRVAGRRGRSAPSHRRVGTGVRARCQSSWESSPLPQDVILARDRALGYDL